MKRKIFLVCIVIVLTIVNFILFKNFYHLKTEKNITKQLTNNQNKNIITTRY